jgi:hypothetical protein
MIRPFRLGLLLTLLVSCSSENFTEIETARASLFPGFESYASREEVVPKLSREVEVKVIEDASLDKGSTKPPYRTYTISVVPMRHLDHRGRLLLTFFNNRLLHTLFYPENLDGYVKVLRQSGVAVAPGQELVSGHTVIWIGADFDNRHYVGWADKRLREQRRRWLANYR